MKAIVLGLALLFSAVVSCAQQSVPVTVPQQMLPIPITITGLPAGCAWTATGGTAIAITITPNSCASVTPPPTKVPSPDGTTITPTTPNGSVTDAALDVWTFGGPLDTRGNVINKNGTATTSAAIQLLYFGAQMYCQTASLTWWGGPGFSVKQPGDPRGSSGNPPAAPTVVVSWTASTSKSVVGYNVYRGGTSGGPYAKISAGPVAATSYTDASVAHSTKYFYTVTAQGDPKVYATVESPMSAEAAAQVN